MKPLRQRLTIVHGGGRSSPPDSHGDAAPLLPELDWSILMARAQAGDTEAYRRLLGEITPYLRTLAARRLFDRSEIEDAVQDVLLTVHRIRRTYDPSRPFGPWLVTIAGRRIVDRVRRQARRRMRETSLLSEHETFAAGEANFHETAPDHRALTEAIQGLPEVQRKAVRLLKLEEMSLREASAASGLSIGSLKVAAHRAVKSLRKIIRSKGSDAR